MTNVTKEDFGMLYRLTATWKTMIEKLQWYLNGFIFLWEQYFSFYHFLESCSMALLFGALLHAQK